MKKLIFTLMAVFVISNVSMAQEVSLKWNPVHIGLGALNVGAEISIAPQWTINFDASAVIFNPWKDIYANGWLATLEGRWYLSETFNGHHFGAYFSYGSFSRLSATNNFFANLFTGGTHPNNARGVLTQMIGLSYGYYLPITERFGIDGYIGGGVAFASHDLADGTRKCETKFSLSKLGIALSYKF